MKSRDEALQTKEQQQAEINTLRDRNRTSQRHSSTQQSFQQPSHQTPQRPSPQQAPRDADEDMENDGGASSTRQAPNIDINAVIQAAVTQALSAFQAANPQSPRTPRSSHRKNQMPKEGSVAHRRQLKKAGLDALKPDVEQAWKDFMRRSIAYQNGTGLGPAELAGCRYRLHFGEYYQTSRWNKAIIENMLELVAIEKEQYKLEGELSIDVLRAMMWDFIKQAQCSWSSLNVRLMDEGRAETKDQARTRANDYRERRSNDSRLNSRKHQKFDVLDKLGVEGQSSEEESDSEPGVLKVTVPHYRRRVITEMMKDLDLRIKEVTDSMAQQSGKRILPQPTHTRRRIERKSERTIRKGLPRSLYHHRFPARLPVAVLEDLKINNKEITGFDQWALAMQDDSDSDEDI
ncbi:hypothetical protein F5050DRAFT_1906062 [Lentinula boryana]|uniref:Uncharacterized protein n=1 Tax=Lentinula boryana TaxID=40481 RepID=A0ABQ8PWG9_9AGAR|nr:hypothetical protein F5050DRAFT_1906062 [Lentinula boryana]